MRGAVVSSIVEPLQNEFPLLPSWLDFLERYLKGHLSKESVWCKTFLRKRNLDLRKKIEVGKRMQKKHTLQLKNEQKRVWAEIDLNAVEWNFNVVKESARGVMVCCVVKANGYGHGAVRLAKFYEKLGADWFAVSNVEEALQLRGAGVIKPILILGYTPAECVPLLLKYRISQCVYSLSYGKQLAEQACKAGGTLNAHIKIDTGMGRLGFSCRDTNGNDELGNALNVCFLSGLQTEGIFTHFAVADEGGQGEAFTKKQYANFQYAIKVLERGGAKFSIKHCSNSAAVLDYAGFELDMVRAGVVLYGIMPSEEIRNQRKLFPVMTLKAVVSNVKTLREGESVSYGRTFVADRDMTVATIPVGYADGFWRSNAAGGAKIFLRGRLLPILGRVCMDQFVVDLQDLSDVVIGEEVVIFGDEPAITVEEIARRNGTIPYEIVCEIGERVPRVYCYNNQIVYVQDNLLK